MKDTDYAYAVARIRANEKKLLTNSDLEQLTDEPSFESAVKFLDDKGWFLGNDFDSISDAVDKQNHAMTALIKEILPKKDEFKMLTVQNDFFNLKTAIKSILGGDNPFLNYIFPTSVDLERLTTLVSNLEFEKLDSMFASCAEGQRGNKNCLRSHSAKVKLPGQSRFNIFEKIAAHPGGLSHDPMMGLAFSFVRFALP